MHSAKHSQYSDIIEHPLEHLRILGPPGSGKTSVLLERCRFLQAEYDKDSHGVVIVTYTKESAESLMEVLLPEMSARRKGEPVYRYYDLAAGVLAAAGQAVHTIGQLEELVLLDQVVSSMPHGGRHGSRSSLRSEKFHMILLRLIRSLIQNGLNSAEVRTLFNQPALNERLAAIPDIYAGYLDGLQHGRFVTDYNICWHAVDVLNKDPTSNPLGDAQVVLIDDFQDVDPGQFALLRKIAPPAGPIKVNVFGDPTAAHFRFKGTQHGFLMDAFAREYDCRTFHLPSVAATPGHINGALAALLAATLEDDACHHLPVTAFDGGLGTGDGDRSGSSEFAAVFTVRPDEFNEVLHVAERARELIADQLCQPHEIAVTAREKHRYDILLSAAFQYYGIPLETGRHRRGVVENFVVELLTLLCSPDDEAAAGSLLASPFYRTFDRQISRLSGSAEGCCGEDDETAALNVLIDAVRKKLFAGPPKDCMASLLKEHVLPVLRDSREKAVGPSAYAYLSRLLGEWGRYVAATGNAEGKTDANYVRGFMSKCSLFQDSFAPLSPVPGRVGFYSCHELKGRTFPVVFLVGCSEMLFPSSKADEGIIPYDVLQRISRELFPQRSIEFYPARSSESHLRDEFSLLLLALTRASHKLFISAPERCGGGVETGPTSIVYDSLPAGIREPDGGHAAGPDGRGAICPPLARWADHLVRAAGDIAEWHGEQLTPHSLDLSPVPLLWHSLPLQEHAVHVSNRPMSPSSLRTFDACPRRYFYSKVLSLPEEDSVAMRFGTLFHKVMKEFGKEFPAMNEMHGAAARKGAERIIESVLAQREDAPESPLVERSIRHYLDQMVERFLDVDGHRSDGYTIRMVESPLAFAYGDCEFIGFVDRLDESNTGRRVVIDYKTGKIKKTGSGIRKDVVESSAKPDERDWQVPLYAFAVLSGGAKPPIVFSYYNIQAGEEPVVVSLVIDDAEPRVDPEALFAGGLKKRFAHLLTAEVKKCMDDAVHLAHAIFAPTNFFVRTEDEDRCRYCSYRTVCRRGEAWN
ncbi:MAG: PD-(D/E)XK nuclease family protein [Candidatus Latescibacterota bacterium]